MRPCRIQCHISHLKLLGEHGLGLELLSELGFGLELFGQLGFGDEIHGVGGLGLVSNRLALSIEIRMVTLQLDKSIKSIIERSHPNVYQACCHQWEEGAPVTDGGEGSLPLLGQYL